jgi:hypothetical protein
VGNVLTLIWCMEDYGRTNFFTAIFLTFLRYTDLRSTFLQILNNVKNRHNLLYVLCTYVLCTYVLEDFRAPLFPLQPQLSVFAYYVAVISSLEQFRTTAI